jgi:lipopolysaccharide transport system ATP-binding protein
MSEVLVRIESVSKKFCRSLKRSLWYGVQDICADLNPFRGNGQSVETHSLVDRNVTHALNPNGTTTSASSGLNIPLANHSQNGLRRDEFWAVNDVSFELKRGECLGLIGRNGAGKTTLLKMLNGLIKPDHGRIEMHGRIGALIALGAGFNPILTGRENIYVNGSVLGLTKREIDHKIEDIIDFAELREFIDSPVQSYSSGMHVRLGFAVATALNPDILLLDEVLAVGDAAFRARCYNRINKLQRGAAVIFVTHSMEQVTRICNKALCLAGGKMLYSGGVENAVKLYAELNAESDDGTESFLSLDEGIESGSVSVEPRSLPKGGMLDVQVQCSTEDTLPPCRIRIVLYAQDGSLVAEYDSRAAVVPNRVTGNNYVFKQTIGPINLIRGRYKIGINLLGTVTPALFLWSEKQCAVEVDGPVAGLSYYQLGAK